MTLAKVSAPKLFGVVPRERLFAQLDAERGRPLVWIEGPPGAGKTTLVASYLEARGLPVLWYQIDEGDADPAGFFHYLGMAAEPLRLKGAPCLPRLLAEHNSSITSFARLFFRQLCEQLSPSTMLVFDNYHDLAADSPVHDLLPVLVEQLHRESSVLVTSRGEPPGSVVEVQARGGLRVLRWDDLRLTLDETRLACEVRGIRQEDVVRALFKRSEGWAAGLTLLSERLEQGSEAETVVDASPSEGLFDYFANKLFDHLPEAMRTVLLSVAYLQNVNAGGAARLSGSPQAGEVLEALYRRRFFTERRTGREPIYQFHALFRDFLQSRVLQTEGKEARLNLCQRTAEVLLGNGEVAAAVDLLLDVEDWEAVARIIPRHAEVQFARGGGTALANRIARIPVELRMNSAELRYWEGRSLLAVQPDRGLAALECARALFEARADTDGEVLALGAMLDAGYIGHLALDRLDAWIDRLEVLSSAAMGDAPSSIGSGVWASVYMQILYARPWQQAFGDAPEHILQELHLCGSSDRRIAVAASGIGLVTELGMMDLAERMVALVRPDLEAGLGNPNEVAWLRRVIGYLRFYQSRYEDALEEFRAGVEAARRGGFHDLAYELMLGCVMIEFRFLGWSVANETLREVESAPWTITPYRMALLCIYQAKRASARNDTHSAAALAIRADEAINATGTAYHSMVFGLFNAELVASDGRLDLADALIARSREIISKGGPLLSPHVAALRFVEAFVALRRGSVSLAQEKLTLALAIARPGNRSTRLRFLECSMPPLFCLALREGIEVDLVQELIRKFRLPPPEDAPENWPRAVRIVTLGRFEVEVRGEPLVFARKVPKKTLNLLQALVAYGRETVPERWLCDALWGDEEADAAHQALSITVVRLRKLLGVGDAVLQRGGKVGLDRRLCSVDAWRFEQCADTGDEAAVDTALSLYRGEFLPDEEAAPWTVTARERLRGKYIQALAGRARTLENSGCAEAALALYERGFDADPIVERFHQGIMRCHRALDQPTEAVAAFRRARRVLSVTLGVAPSSASEALYREILASMGVPEGGETPAVIPRRGPLRATRKADRAN